MGISLPTQHPFLVRALLASIALHVAFALFVPTVAWLQSDGPTVETLSFVRVMHISVSTPRPALHPPAAAAPLRATLPRIIRTTPSRTRIPSHRAPATSAKGQAQAPFVAQTTPGAAAATAVATGAPSTAPQQQVATAETRHDAGGYMPFGADVPVPVLDPSVVKRLAALNVHVTLTVVVDENGRTKSVSFDPPLDGAMENQMRAMLADASWDPAVCGGGVACEGRTTIKL